MEEPLKGKVTLVTGAAGGIGRKICETFARMGSFVYLCDIHKAADLADGINDVYDELRTQPVACDIAKKEDVLTMFGHIETERDGVDILINNAAVYGPLEAHHFPDISYDDFLKTIKIDLSGALYCTLMAVPYMKKQKWGKIVFSAAPLSSSGIPSPYLAGKSGFIGMTKHLAQRYGNDGISSFALVLRHVGTPMIERVIQSRGHGVDEGLKKMHDSSLTGRMISPEEIADIYAYFCTATSSRINGITLLSDGGITYLK